MPDLATHAAVGYLAAADGRRVFMFSTLWGSLLPDVIANAPVAIWNVAAAALEWPRMPASFVDALTAFHAPLMFVGLCWTLALGTPAAIRRQVVRGLLLGGLLHIAADLLQWHVLPGAYLPLFPVAWMPWEAGWFDTESSLRAWPVLAIAVLVRAALRTRQRHHVPRVKSF